MTILELSMAAVGVIGALAGLIHGSKCKTIKIKLTGCECERDVSENAEEESKEQEMQPIPKPNPQLKGK